MCSRDFDKPEIGSAFMVCFLFLALQFTMLNHVLDWSETQQTETRGKDRKTNQEKEPVAEAVLR